MVHVVREGGTVFSCDLRSKEWSNTSISPVPFNTPVCYWRDDSSVVVVGTSIIVTGGCSYVPQLFSRQYQENVFCYDPGRHLWELLPNMLQKRSGHESISYNGHVYVFGGNEIAVKGGIFGECLDLVATTTNVVQWTPLPEPPGLARDFRAAIIGDKIVLLGGGGGNKGIFWVLDPVRLVWSVLQSSLPWPVVNKTLVVQSLPRYDTEDVPVLISHLRTALCSNHWWPPGLLELVAAYLVHSDYITWICAKRSDAECTCESRQGTSTSRIYMCAFLDHPHGSWKTTSSSFLIPTKQCLIHDRIISAATAKKKERVALREPYNLRSRSLKPYDYDLRLKK
jgi:hypothetical protein